MAPTLLCLRPEAPCERTTDEYRIHDGDVEVRRHQGPTQNDRDWRRLTAEELTHHVYRNTAVALWLERRLGWRHLLRACVGEQNQYQIESAENRGDRRAA